jgi:molybdenum cofactor cytidylyltransferase
MSPVFHPSGRKLLAKGRQISEEDIQLLSLAGHERVAVAVLDEGEVPEEEAAMQLASTAAHGVLTPQLAPGGRANLCAVENCCLTVDDSGLRALNQTGAVSAATLSHFSYASAGQRVGTIKTPPFAIPRHQLQEALRLVRERGPLLEARPIRQPVVAILYCDPLKGDRARALYEAIMRTRLERVGTNAAFVLSCLEEEEPIARNLEHLLRARPTLVIVASTTAPAGPHDAVGRAMERIGCRIESFLAPVEPGNLLLLAYTRDVPVVSAPGCYRSPRSNVVDLVLPPLLAKHRLTARDISAFGHGGLLQ